MVNSADPDLFSLHPKEMICMKYQALSAFFLFGIHIIFQAAY